MISWWCGIMIRTILQGSALIVLTLLFTQLVGKSRPAVRSWLWWLVLAHFALAWAFAIPVRMKAVPSTTIWQTNVVQDLTRAIPATASPGSSANSAFDFRWTLFGVWAVGAFGVVLSVCLSTWKMRKISRDGNTAPQSIAGRVRQLSAEVGLSKSPKVVITEQVGAPATYGFIRHYILLPKSFVDLSEKEQEMALVHEIGHLLRRDPLLSLIAQLASALFWFYPPVYFARREWSVERELDCDRLAVEKTGDGLSYRRFLLRIIGTDSVPLPRTALGATSDFRCLRRRLVADLTVKGRRYGLIGALAIVTVSAMALPIRIVGVKQSGGLLVNSSFEDGSGKVPDNWNAGEPLDGVQYVWDDKVSHTGQHSLSIQKRVDRYFPIAEWRQRIPYNGVSGAIEFDGWVKADRMYKTVLTVLFATDEGISTYKWVAFVGAKNTGDPPETFDWRRLGGVAKIPAGTKQIIFALQGYGPGKIWLDDVSANYVHERHLENQQ